MSLLIKNKFKNPKVILTIIVLIQIFGLLFLMKNKSSFYCDEIYTYSLANSQYGHIFPPRGHSSNLIITDKWISGNFFQKHICVTENSKFNFSNAFLNNINDSHPPFYNYIIHFICSFFPNTFSKWYGFSLNIIFFIATQILLFSISKKIIKSDKYALLTCFLYGCCSASIDCFILIRVYSLLTFFYLLLFYIYLACLDFNFSIKRFLIIISVISLGGLTHYHFYIYAFFLTLTFIIICMIKKKQKMFWLVSISAVSGVILAFSYFPFLFYQLKNSPRGKEALLLGSRFSTIIASLSNVYKEFFDIDLEVSNILSVGLIISFSFYLIIILSKYFKEIDTSALNLTIISFISYNLFIYHTFDFVEIGYHHTVRYFFPIYPTLTIIIVIILAKFSNKILTIFISILCVLSGFFMLDFNYPCSNDKYLSFQKLEEIIKDNNLIVHYKYPEENENICPIFINANKVYIDSNTSEMVNVPKSLPSSGKNYLIYFNYSKPNQLNYKKVLEGYLWSYGTRYELYYLD